MKAGGEEKNSASHAAPDLAQSYIGSARERRDQERAARADNMKEAWASVGLEGDKPSEFAKNAGQQYIDGEITAKELVQLVRAHYGLTANIGDTA